MDVKSRLPAGRERRNYLPVRRARGELGAGFTAPCGYRSVPGPFRAVAMPGLVCPHRSTAQCFPAPLIAEPTMPPLPPASRHVTAMGAAKESHRDSEEVAPL